MLTMAAPACAQIVMMAVMVAEGRWPFVAMIVPGLVGCLASLMLANIRHRREWDGTADDAGRPVRDSPAVGPVDDFAAMGPRTLESLLGLDGEPLPWRRIVGWWLEGGDLRVPIGCDASGVHRIDLARQGPHALVAGTTGSGKSVLLQSWCLALAARNPPTALRFVFLDFKGGAAFAPLERLPHTVGSVCDLDLAHASRAMRALEAELTGRERLVALERAGSFDRLETPPPRMVVVIDEFHALRGRLPDGVERLARIASLGRSLGMHVIACTQNPLGQVGADMKANMNLNICLRVRDPLQSTELIGSARAAAIGPATPGAAYRADGESVTALRCCVPADIDALAEAVGYAAAFHGMRRPEALFTPPLPARVTGRDLAAATGAADAAGTQHSGGAQDTTGTAVAFGLADDGVRFGPALIDVACGNIAVVGPFGRGKSTLLHTLAHRIRRGTGAAVRITRRVHGEYRTDGMPARPSALGTPSESGAVSVDDKPDAGPAAVWICDDADALLDPLNADPPADALRRALADPGIAVVAAVEDSRRIRDPARFPCRVVFPTGDRATDMMDGLPAEILAGFGPDDLSRPGRGVLLRSGRATPVQCLAPDAADVMQRCRYCDDLAVPLASSGETS